LCVQGCGTGELKRLVNGLRVNGLVLGAWAVAAGWTAAVVLGAPAGARPLSRSVLAIARVRKTANTAANTVTVIARGRWGR
jgi:hypothetical protein